MLEFIRELAIASVLILIVSAHVFAQSTIKIGFLIRDKNDVALSQAALLAINDANARGGYKGQKFELVVRSCDGPWGIGSKQAVSLIHDDGALIVVGALDGRNAHLAEQVTAKSHIVMLSTLSSDPTLSRAYVPWYFRIIPDDRQQAEALAEQIYLKNKAKKVVVIALDNYDGKMSAEAFVAVVKDNAYPNPEVFIASSEKELLQKIAKNPWDAVVFAGTPKQSDKIFSTIKSQNTYAFLNIFNFMSEYQPETMKDIRFVHQTFMENQAWRNFQDSYWQKYHATPAPAMAYVYDGIVLACEAVKKFGPDTEAIRKGFKNLKYEGITGRIEFGKLGNREIPLK
jgi:branched-chain amino acid transport system substrate-binding protein